MAQNTATDDAPRNEIDIYGEPVAEWSTEREYFEAYTDDDRPALVFVASYTRHDGEWVKDGFERMRITDIYQTAYNRRKN